MHLVSRHSGTRMLSLNHDTRWGNHHPSLNMNMIERGTHLREKDQDSQQTLLTGVNDETLQRPSMPVVGFANSTPGGTVTSQETKHQERSPKSATPINQAGSTPEDTCQRAAWRLGRKPWLMDRAQSKHLNRHWWARYQESDSYIEHDMDHEVTDLTRAG